MQNSMVMFAFLVFDWKYPFWANLVLKIKIITFRWNLVARSIRICRTQWCCSLFSFSTGNTYFGWMWFKKSKNINLDWNLVPRLIGICGIQWWCSHFWFLTGSTLFGQIWSIKSELPDQAEIWKTILWKLIYIFLQNDKAAWEKLNLYYLNKKKASPTCHTSLKLRTCLNGKYS